MDNIINMGEFIGAATGDKRHMLGKFLYFSLSNLLVEKEELSALKKLPWFKVALKYGIAIELNDKRTIGCLTDFVSGNGDVIECYDSRLLERIIKIIVLTASKVKSTSTSVHAEKNVSVTEEVKQQVQQAIAEVDDWEW